MISMSDLLDCTPFSSNYCKMHYFVLDCINVHNKMIYPFWFHTHIAFQAGVADKIDLHIAPATETLSTNSLLCHHLYHCLLLWCLNQILSFFTICPLIHEQVLLKEPYRSILIMTIETSLITTSYQLP